jgi:hypothetical protein
MQYLWRVNRQLYFETYDIFLASLGLAFHDEFVANHFTGSPSPALRRQIKPLYFDGAAELLPLPVAMVAAIEGLEVITISLRSTVTESEDRKVQEKLQKIQEGSGERRKVQLEYKQPGLLGLDIV